MPEQTYQRDKNGIRLDLAGGINTMLATDAMQAGFPYLENVRRNLLGQAVSRPALGGNLLSAALASGPTSMIRMNDETAPNSTTPAHAPHVLIMGAAGTLYVDPVSGVTLPVANGLTGKPLSFVTFRPNASPQPWCYVADAPVSPDPYLAPTVNLLNPAYGPVAGMLKVRSDGLTYKTGIAEPQAPPGVTNNIPGGTPGPDWVIYRYTYRSSITGAVSNPSPESLPLVVPQVAVTKALAVSDANYLTNFVFNSAQYEHVGGSNYLRSTGSVYAGQVTDYVIATKFGFAIPATTKIDGIQIQLNWAGQVDATGLLTGAALYSGGTQIGSPKFPNIQNVAFVGSSGTTITLGGGADDWGAILTPDVVNDSSSASGFGFGVQITVENGSGGNTRSFLYTFTVTVYYTTVNLGITATGSNDPQVDKIDFYRSDTALENFTYVGTVPNPPTGPFIDTLTDLAVAANPILQFDNFEPFPSIDLPRKGTVTVAANGVVSYQTGDLFNPRWLPGTIILINGVAFTLYNRPVTTTVPATLVAYNSIIDPVTGLPAFQYPPIGSGLSYEIPEPSLAAQPSPVMWGPTPDNIGAYTFGLDPLNPGDLVFSKGNNLDSAPDTNRMGVTSPAEPLMNGVITSELNTVFSAERFWLIYPNFADAVATVTGTEGQQWTLTQSQATRGLYMRYAIGALGGVIAYRAKDCIALSEGGGAEKSLTDSIYNLFPHGGSRPQPVTIGGKTVYPPDDTRPNAQTISVTPSYILYNYQDLNGTQRTLVYDIASQGWSVDTYTPPANCHLWTVTGPTTDFLPAQLLTGNVDGTVRALGDGGEVGTCFLATRSENGGDVRALKRIGDIFIRALVTDTVTISIWRSRFTAMLGGFAPTSLLPEGYPYAVPYIIDITSGLARDLDDVAVLFSWPLGSGDILDTWQPDWTELPEIVQDRPSDWNDGGNPENKFVQGMLLECNTFGFSKSFQVESDDGVFHTPVEVPFVQNGQAIRSFTFNPPFTAHMIRIVSTDGVEWMFGPSGGWSTSLITQPYPESSTSYTTEFSSFGLHGYIHAFQMNLAYISSTPVTVTMNTDQGPYTLTFPPAGSGTQPAKILLKFPRNKWKISSFSVTSSAPFNMWKDLSELWLKEWGSEGPYEKTFPFGGDTTTAAPI
jgi:hypothetical protein